METQIEKVISRRNTAKLLDRSNRTLRRYEAQGLLTPIRHNCRVVVYRESEVLRILNGEIETAPDRPTPAPVGRSASGQFIPSQPSKRHSCK